MVSVTPRPLPTGWLEVPYNLYTGGPSPTEHCPDSPVKARGSLQTTDAEVPESNTKKALFDDDKHNAFRNNREFLNDVMPDKNSGPAL